jgi:hypothetical protein
LGKIWRSLSLTGIFIFIMWIRKTAHDRRKQEKGNAKADKEQNDQHDESRIVTPRFFENEDVPIAESKTFVKQKNKNSIFHIQFVI